MPSRDQPQARFFWLQQLDGRLKRASTLVLTQALSNSEGFGQVAERSKAADCKSAGPCGLRRFESPPVHQSILDFGLRILDPVTFDSLGVDEGIGREGW